MAQLALGDRATTRAYGLLSGRISEILSEESPRLLSHSDREAIEEGVRFLRRCVEGSKLVEGTLSKGAVPPGLEDIRALGYALSTLEFLPSLSHDNDASKALNDLASSLSSIQQLESIPGPSRDQLRDFFSALAREFLRDIANQDFREATPGRLLRAKFV